MQHVPVDTDKETRINELVESWLNNRVTAWMTAELGEERDGLDREASRLYREAMTLGASDYTFHDRVRFMAVREIHRLRGALATSERFRLEDATDQMEDVNHFRHHAAQVVADLLGSADCEWEVRGEGHDWREACQRARSFVRMHGKST